MKTHNNQTADILECQQINKSFGSNQVLFDVSLKFTAGKIHALVGENGAGKSTMMNILAGIYLKDSGKILMGNNEIDIHSPKSSQKHGIMLMHQELSIFPEMSVAENIFASHLPLTKRLRLIDWNTLYRNSDTILEELDCGLHARDKVGDLSVANRHICEFARFLSMQSKYIILDEPTAALTEKEKEIIFKCIRKLKDTYNLGIIYISHRMHEIFEIADEVSILRDGRMQGTFPIKEINDNEVTRLMIGYDVGKVAKQDNAKTEESPVVIEVKNLSYHNDFVDINFSIREGEILGLAGLLGARRTEIAETIFGIRKSTSGQIVLRGKKLETQSVRESIENSIALVPADRKLQGLVLGMNCLENMTLTILERVVDGGILSSKKEMIIYKKFKDIFAIKNNSHKQKLSELSGGNQQKIVLSKWLASEPSVLILDEPTRGIDVGAKAEIYKLIQELASQGYAILLITSDMLELLTLSTRVQAIHDGRMSALLEGDDMTEDAVIDAMSQIVK